MKVKIYKPKVVSVRCECGCGILEVARWKNDDIVLVNYFPTGFYAYQAHWKERLRAIWALIRGKDYQLYELTMTTEELREYKDKILEILNYQDPEELDDLVDS